MSGRHVMLSSERHGWLTPPWFLELVRRVGPIACDPATAPSNPTGARTFYARPAGSEPGPGWLGSCGLEGAWPAAGLTFVNPPYGPFLTGRMVDGVQVADPHYVVRRRKSKGAAPEPIGVGVGWGVRIAAHEGETIALVPVRTETAWWRPLYRWCDYALLWSSPEYGSRISFIDPDTGEESVGSQLASTVFYRGPRRNRFCAVFRPHGELLPGPRIIAALEARAARRPPVAREAEQLALGGAA